MELPRTYGRYTLFYDESNNVRALRLEGDQYNIDNDKNQIASPNFVLGGIACKDGVQDPNFETLRAKLRIHQKSATELKFKHLVEIKANHTQQEAFGIALNSARCCALFEWLEENEIFIHYQVTNLVYWTFLDIIEDLVLCLNQPNEYEDQFFYKNCLYRLIKLNKPGFLALMSKFDYPNISHEKSLPFLQELYELNRSAIANLFIKNDQDSPDPHMLLRLGLLLYKCITLHSSDIKFDLVYENKKHLLIENLSGFYSRRIKMFPKSKQIFDDEKKVEKILKKNCVWDSELSSIDYKFVKSEDADNIPIQISDAVAGFGRCLYDFLESSSPKNVTKFKSSLNLRQKKTLDVFSRLVEASVSECDLFFYRVIVPSDEDNGAILFS